MPRETTLSLFRREPTLAAAMSILSGLPAVLQPKEEDIQKMLSAQAHMGTRNSDKMMQDYIWRRRQDGIHIINVGKTFEKLQLAAAPDVVGHHGVGVAGADVDLRGQHLLDVLLALGELACHLYGGG